MSFSVNIPGLARLESLRSQSLCRLAHRSRLLGQTVLGGDLSVAGGYHCGNLGDMALGEAVRLRAKRSFDRPQLQTIYNLHRWPLAKSLVVGGGAVAYAGPLSAIAKLYSATPEQVAFLGVDFNDIPALEQHRDFYRHAAFVGCRSSEQARALATVLPGAKIGWTYDLAFSLADSAEAISARSASAAQRENIFGFSLVPFMVKRQGTTYVAGSSFMAELGKDRPDLTGRVSELAEKYARWMRQAVTEMLDAGFRARHIPFTPDDTTYARACLAGLPVEFLRYRHTPLPVLADVGRCRYFLSARYHSLIFSLITQTPVVAFEYATKCGRLMDDLGFRAGRIGWDQLLSSQIAPVVTTARESSAVLGTSHLEEISGGLSRQMDAVFSQLRPTQDN